MTQFKQLICWAIILVFISHRPAAVGAASWEDEKKVWEETARGQEYKDPGYAAKLSLNIMPIDQGHFYVGDVKRGVWTSLFQTIAVIAIAVPVLDAKTRSDDNKSPVWTPAALSSAVLGTISFLSLKVWSAFDSAESAKRYNQERQKNRSLKQ